MKFLWLVLLFLAALSVALGSVTQRPDNATSTGTQIIKEIIKAPCKAGKRMVRGKCRDVFE
uniref:Cysteine rich secreted protein n=1 Tax=Riptortus pedestris TaxID=329032 RepID=R4WNA3_RIPPE|nr:unknown secreted protein [Riptortus pedestris]